MPYEDLRDYLATLAKYGELTRVAVEVDWKYEAAGWVRRSMELRPTGPALLFENIKDYPGWRLYSGGLGTYRRIALALGLAPETPAREIIAFYKDRMKQPLKPRLVKTGPVKENIRVGKEVNLFELPVPWLNPRDGGRYLGTWHANVTKDAGNRIRNVGMYRVMVRDENHGVIGFLPFSHIGHHFSQRKEAGQPLEMAVVIGADETVPIAAATGAPPNLDEYELAGALRGEPIDLVKCETVDLEVPANAEIVIEGLVLTDEVSPEGPFGEHCGYHSGGVRKRPVFQVTAITFRNDPIFRFCVLGKPVTEDHVVMDVVNSAGALGMFEAHGPEGVIGVHCPPEGDSHTSAIIQMKPRYVGHSRNAARALLSSAVGKYLKYIVVVDEDIDPFDLGEVWWAILTRTQGSRDIEVLKFGPTSKSDPSVPRNQGEFTDKVIIDATKKLDYPYEPVWQSHWAPVCLPPQEIYELVSLKWNVLDGRTDAELNARIEALSREISEVQEPRWEKIREEVRKAYQSGSG